MPTKLHIVVTDAKNGKKIVLSNHHKFVDIYEEFRATAALPFLYDKPVLVNGRWHIDGGVCDLLPVDVAVKLGCTDIVVVLTQPIANYKFDQRHSRLVKRLVKHFARRQPAAIQKILPTNERLLQLNLHLLTHPSKKVRFYVLEPSDPEAIISLASMIGLKLKHLPVWVSETWILSLHKPLQH